MRRFIFLSLAFTACSHAVRIDRTFDPYVRGFVREAAERQIQAVLPEISFDSTLPYPEASHETAAQCSLPTWRRPYAKISVNREVWNRLPEMARRALIYHELGHCVFAMDHTGRGVMNPYIERVTEEDFSGFWSE